MATYTFRDPTVGGTNLVHSTEAISIDGDELDYEIDGFKTLYVKGRESMSADVSLSEIGRGHGAVFNYKRYPERTLTVGFQVTANSQEEYLDIFDQLNRYLTKENVLISFRDEPDKYFIGTPSTISDIEPGRTKVVGEFDIVCVDPFKYAQDETCYKLAPGDNTISNTGAFPVPFRFLCDFGHEIDKVRLLKNDKELAFGADYTGAVLSSNGGSVSFTPDLTTENEVTKELVVGSGANDFVNYARITARFLVTGSRANNGRIRVSALSRAYWRSSADDMEYYELGAIEFSQIEGPPTISFYVADRSSWRSQLRLVERYYIDDVNEFFPATFFIRTCNDTNGDYGSYYVEFKAGKYTSRVYIDPTQTSSALQTGVGYPRFYGMRITMARTDSSGTYVYSNAFPTFQCLSSEYAKDTREDYRPKYRVGDRLDVNTEDASTKWNHLLFPELGFLHNDWNMEIEPGVQTVRIEGLSSKDAAYLCFRRRWL